MKQVHLIRNVLSFEVLESHFLNSQKRNLILCVHQAVDISVVLIPCHVQPWKSKTMHIFVL